MGVSFGQGRALPMTEQRSDETLRDFVARRERELVKQVRVLRDQLASKENELLEVQRATAALGIRAAPAAPTPKETTKPTHPKRRLSDADYVMLAQKIKHASNPSLTIKELIIRAFLDQFREGGKPGQIGQHIHRSYGRRVESGSIRPNLARLRFDGLIRQGVGTTWILDPYVADLMRPVYDAPNDEGYLMLLATSLAWRDEPEEEPAQNNSNGDR
jgi:hypothetical protein